jgi:acetyl esterase/lipase
MSAPLTAAYGSWRSPVTSDLTAAESAGLSDVLIEGDEVHYADRLTAPVIFFQGDEDRVVPPDQTEVMVEALRRKGVPVGYLLFSCEQHGFRRGANAQRALDAELYFSSALVFKTGLTF